MRKLSASEMKTIQDDLFNGRPVSVEVEDFDMGEFALQLDAAQSRKAGKDDSEDAEQASAKVGGRSSSSS